MMNDDATVAALSNAMEQGFSGSGSPARMAALLLLGTHPAGVRSDDLRRAIRNADARVWDESRMQNVLTAIRTAGLAGVERDDKGSMWWYSPGAREVARLRGQWPPAGLPARQVVKRIDRRYFSEAEGMVGTSSTATTGATA
jgi:hypothetical protein